MLSFLRRLGALLVSAFEAYAEQLADDISKLSERADTFDDVGQALDEAELCRLGDDGCPHV